MKIIAKRKKGESALSLLRRFTTRFQRSGLVLEVRKKRYTRDIPGSRSVKNSKLYRLGIAEFIAKKMKAGWDVEKALKLARKYVQIKK